MTEQDILNKIKESADSVEIPESLKPEQIELKLKEEKQPLKFRWQAMHLVAAAVVLVIMLGVMPLGLTWGGKGDTAANENTAGKDATVELIVENQQNATAPEMAEAIIDPKQDAGELYLVAKSEQEVYDFLKENAKSLVRDYYYTMDDGVIFEAVEEEATGAVFNESVKDLANTALMESAPTSQDATSSTTANKLNYSTTNLQMAGVDESDIVKTNGSHIFMVKDGVVNVVKIDNGQMTNVGTISPELQSFSDQVLEMYVDDDKLIMVVQQLKDGLDAMNTSSATGGLLQLNGETMEVCVDVAYNFDASYETALYVYDISNPANAKQVGRMEQDGWYKTSRKIGNIVYLFTQDTVATQLEMMNDDLAELDEILPEINGKAIAYDSIYLPEYGYQGLLVSSVSLDKPDEIVDNTLIMNDYVEIYVSSNAMYLYNTEYRSETPHTQIAKFSLKNGHISAVAAATVPGTIQDTFAINEYQGNLRVLTSHWNVAIDDRTNQLYILDENLKAAGKIENIAEGETIYAARYFGDLAYFITYRNIDPLFAADLSDIHNPKILGELKITGYSEYLHMWGEDKLLGIGYETDEEKGNREGIKLVMFDISNPAELSIIDTVVIKTADYSPALSNYKAVLADLRKNMIGFVTADYSEDNLEYRMYSFTDGKFVEELVVEKDTLKYRESYRGLWAGNYFYMVSPAEIQSFDYMDNYKAVGEFAF